MTEPGTPGRAAVVLCGGQSRRMGRDKASLPFGARTLLEHVAACVEPLVDEVVVVARQGQNVPGDHRVAHDVQTGAGPLAGIVAGLRAVEAERVFVTACDAPLMVPAFVERMFELSEGFELAVPQVDGHYMVLSAVYDRSLLARAEALLEADRLRPFYLVEQASTRIVTADELTDIDPELDSLRDCDTPSAYAFALERAGLS